MRPLLEVLQRETDWGASRIGDTLVAFGSAAVPDLARYALLSDPSLSSASAHLPLVARVLGIIGDVRSEPAMLSALESEDGELRIRAAAALGTVGSLACVPALIRALRDPEWEVRAQAAAALGRQMDGRAIEAFRRRCATRTGGFVRTALRLSPRSRGALGAVRGLEDEDRFARDAAIERLMAMGLVRKAVEAVKDGSAGEQERFVVRQLVVLGRGEYLQEKAANEKVAG